MCVTIFPGGAVIKSDNLKKSVTAALFAALTCVSTMVIQIPSPMQGYVNLGDSFVLLSGWLLGPAYGFGAAGIGSMLADLLTGYAHYAPATFLIKGLMAVIGAVIYRTAGKALPAYPRAARVLSGSAGEIFMVIGYFLYACLILGNGLAAAASIPGNLMQGLFGVVASVLLIEILGRTGLIRKYF
jgi:uncharacterized membrane protein